MGVRRGGGTAAATAALRSAAVVLAGAGALAACTHYAPAPPPTAAFPAAFDARRLEAPPAGAAWTGPELLRAALARNPQVAEARAKYLTALAAVRTARVPPNAPSLTLTAEYANETPHWGYEALSDIPLDLGKGREARITTAQLQALQALYDYGETVWTVRTALEKARVDLVATQGEIALADQAVDLRRQRLERLQARVAAGEDARFALLAAQSEAATAERRAVDARGRLGQARSALARAIGVPDTAVQAMAAAPAPPIPALDPLPTWRREAALSRRDVLRAVADYDLAENALRAEVAKQYPQVRIGPGYFYDHGVTKLPFNVALQLPPVDMNRAAIAQAETARAQAGQALEAAQAGALGEVDAAATALAAARASAARATADLEIARRTVSDTARTLQAGEADRVDDLGARAAEAEGRLAVADAEHAVATASAELENALRRPFDPGEAPVLQDAITRAGATP